MRARMRRGLGSWVLVVGLGCGPQVQIEDDSSGDGESSTTSTTSMTLPPGDSTAMASAAVTTTPVTTTEGLDDGPRLDLPADVGMQVCVDWATMGCGTPAQGGLIVALTPVGDFLTAVAVFGGQAGCGGWCGEEVSSNIQRIVLAADPMVLQDLQPWDLIDDTVAIEFEAFDGPVGVPVPARVWASKGGVSEFYEYAEVVIDGLPAPEQVADPFDPSTAVVVTGSVTLDVPGWSVNGDFAAAYCPDLNEYYICE